MLNMYPNKKDDKFDKALHHAVNEKVIREVNSISLNEELNKLIPVERRRDIRIEKLFEHKQKAPIRLVRIAASILVAIFLSFGLFFSLTENARATIRETLIIWYTEFARFVFPNNPDTSQVVYEGSMWRPSHIPEGFEKYDLMEFGVFTMLEYINKEGDIIMFRITLADGSSVAVDNEHAEHFTLEQGGITYHVFAPTSAYFPTNIIWEDRGFSFLINGNIDHDSLIKMALSVEIIE